MPEITRKCRLTGKEFVITEWEQEFIKKMGFPLPTLCLEERHRRRLAHRNERNLYEDKCDLTGKPIISIYSPEKPYKVYSQEAWWSDDWDSRDYGRDFDFSRPFFEQFKELQLDVPRVALMNTKSENSEYCNVTTSNKNCYLVFGGDFNEDCIYSTFNFHSKNVCDVYWVDKSELLYECIDCNQCYDVMYSRNSTGCHDSKFLFECRNCENCIGCVGLRSKKYHIFNKSYSKEEYEKKVEELKLHTWSGIKKIRAEFDKFRLQFPHRHSYIINCENSTGNHLTNCQNCLNCFDVTGPAKDLKDVVLAGFGMNDALSSNHIGHKSELFYEMLGSFESYNCAFCSFAWMSQNIFYCDLVTNSENLFGCTNMKKAQYCIFNKQYTEKEYEDLKEKIIAHMKSTGEWGEYFPGFISPFGYNETVVQEYAPLEKEEALKKGFNWCDYENPDPKVEKVIPAAKLPESIEDVPDDVLNWAIECEVSKKPFKIIPQELKFYREKNIPLPRKHHEIRHKERLNLRTPWRAWERNCDKCGVNIRTAYSPKRPEKIYCEECYLKEVY